MRCRTLVALYIVISLLLCLTGCASDSQEISVEVTCEEFKDQPSVSRNLEVIKGATFKVILCSTPASGFKWQDEAEISTESILEQVSHIVEVTSFIDVSSHEVWTFEALKEGKSSIYLEYNRPWVSDNQSFWSFNLDVVVTDEFGIPPSSSTY
jgi:predicted secreted protein